MLRSFYSEGYNVLGRCNQIDAFFISDCGVLIAEIGRDNHLNNFNIDNIYYLDRLRYLLRALRILNSAMLEHEIMLTTSIAYGHFVYRETRERFNMEKNLLYGPAYLSAYLDNESGKPKIQPGQCRIVNENLPHEIINKLNDINLGQDNMGDNDRVITLLRKRRGDPNHFYFYWMRHYPYQIEDFEASYNDAYKLKYEGFLSALKGDT